MKSVFDSTDKHEWYKKHRFSFYPDIVEQDFLYNRNEFSLGYEISFEKHLNNLKKYNKYE